MLKFWFSFHFLNVAFRFCFSALSHSGFFSLCLLLVLLLIVLTSASLNSSNKKNNEKESRLSLSVSGFSSALPHYFFCCPVCYYMLVRVGVTRLSATWAGAEINGSHWSLLRCFIYKTKTTTKETEETFRGKNWSESTSHLNLLGLVAFGFIYQAPSSGPTHNDSGTKNTGQNLKRMRL